MRLSSDMKILLPLIIWVVMMTLDAQLVCWQALVRCHEERECELAYNQYLSACDGNIRGERRQCPSHCISALIRLNQTGSGPDLERCSCETDAECLSAKRAIDPCLPRTYPSGAESVGCTEARRRCEDDPACYAALMAYLSRCGQLFNGRRCSPQCRDTIGDLLLMPNGVTLNTCVCDGLERPFCEVVKQNMAKLCLIGDPGGEQDDAYEDEDYEVKPGSEASDAVMSSSGAAAVSRRVALLLVLAAFETL